MINSNGFQFRKKELILKITWNNINSPHFVVSFFALIHLQIISGIECISVK